MKKNVFALFLCFFFVKSVQAYNMTEAKRAGVVAGAQILTSFLFIQQKPQQSLYKFSTQFAIGIDDPIVSVAALWFQQAYLGDKTALSSALTLFNRIVATQVAQIFETSEAIGYLAAAAVNLAGILDLLKGPMRTGLIEYKRWGALANALEQYTQSKFVTGIVSGGLGALLLSHSPKIGTALVVESGIRVLPAMLEMSVSEGFVQQAATLALGIPVIAWANRMIPGQKREFVTATGMSFLIASVYSLMNILLQKIDN